MMLFKIFEDAVKIFGGFLRTLEGSLNYPVSNIQKILIKILEDAVMRSLKDLSRILKRS